MISDNETIAAFLKGLFSENPAKERDIYFPSALMDIRRAMADTSQFVKEEALNRRSHRPKELRFGLGLPPWETELLAQMFVGRPVILVQGGSGCGKTSALSFVREYCHNIPWSSDEDGFGYRSVLLTVDLQDQPDYLKKKMDSEEERQNQSRHFLTALVEGIDAHLQLALTVTQLGRLFTATFLSDDYDQSADYVTRAVQVRQRVHVKYRDTQLTQTPTWTTIQPALKALESQHDQVIARYLLLQELGCIQRQEHNRALVLAIDNIDPFPEYLQRDLIRTLETVAHGSTALTIGRPDSFSIVVFARFSTASRHSGTLDGVSAHRVNFRAPDPADLVFYKLSGFLMNPGAAAGWTDISEEDRDELLGRAWYLWERLASPKSQFSEVLSGLAGTNSRSGYKLATWWLMSRRLAYPMATKETADALAMSRPLAFALLLRMAHAVARGLLTVSAEIETIDEWEKAVVKLFFAHLLGIMVDNHVVRKLGQVGEDGRDARAHLAGKAREHLAAFMADPKWERLRAITNAPVAEAVYEVSRPIKASVAMIDYLTGGLERALRREEEALRDSWLERLEQGDRHLAQALCLWLIEGAVRGAVAINRKAAEGDPSDVLPEVVRPFAKAMKPNRWEAVSILVSPDARRSRTHRSAINLFSADGASLSPVALHVLCLLEEKDQGLQGIVIRERLRILGFTDHQTMRALMDMVDVDRRLIYSGVKDFTYGLEGWFDSLHDVRISSAGSGYLNKVASTPAYLQWALLEPTELYEKLGGEQIEKRLEIGSGRLELVLNGLKLVASDESDRLVKLGSVDMHYSLSPLAWVFFRSLNRFIKDISGYKASDARSLAAEFLAFAMELRAERLGLFGVFPKGWDYWLSDAQKEFDERFA